MKITPIYKHHIISLPSESVLDNIATATRDELAVLIAVMAENGGEFELAEMCARLDMTENAFKRALERWSDAMTTDNEASSSEKKADITVKPIIEHQKSKNISPHSSLPNYSNDEISTLIETKREYFELVNSCQQILGKIFNAHDTSIVIGLIDHLALSSEYILLLCTHAVQVGKKSLRYIEQLAISLYDNDIITYSALEEELKHIEERASVETFVRKLFGIGRRTLIPKEKEFIKTWNDKYKFSREMICAAYEITVSKTGEPSIKYANAILENWFTSGLKTPADVEAAEAERAKKRDGDTKQASSFTTDGFYEAALLRAYGDNNDT